MTSSERIVDVYVHASGLSAPRAISLPWAWRLEAIVDLVREAGMAGQQQPLAGRLCLMPPSPQEDVTARTAGDAAVLCVGEHVCLELT